MGKDSLRRALAALSLLAAVPAIGGCAAPSSYAGISLAPGTADAELQGLAVRAQAGDKQAQLEIGIRYEEGRGLPVNFERAEQLYAEAAADRRAIHIYTPSVGRRHGRVLPVRHEPSAGSLKAASERLTNLRRRRDASDGEHRPTKKKVVEDTPVDLRSPRTAPTPPASRFRQLASSLSAREIWERMVQAVSSRAELTPQRVEQILGAAPQLREELSELSDTSREVVLGVIYAQWTCPISKERRFSSLCTPERSVVGLHVEGGTDDDSQCLTNREFVERLQRAGWRLTTPAPGPPEGEGPLIHHYWMHRETLVRPDAYLEIGPLIAWREGCVNSIRYYRTMGTEI